MTPELKSPTDAGGGNPNRIDRTKQDNQEHNANAMHQQELFPAPPPTDEEAAIRRLLIGFGEMLLTEGSGSLSHARAWMETPEVLKAIRPHKFGSIPRRFDAAIRPAGITRATHAGGGNHFLLRYEVADPDALAQKVQELKGIGI